MDYDAEARSAIPRILCWNGFLHDLVACF